MDKNILLANRQDPSNKENYIRVHFQSKFEKHKQTFSVNKVSLCLNKLTLVILINIHKQIILRVKLNNKMLI